MKKVLFLAISLMMISTAMAAPKPIRMAITIDDLPAAGVESIGETRKDVSNRFITVLKKHKIDKVYGFLNGILSANMAERGDILKDWKKAGHLLGNHTYSHKDLGKVSAEEFIEDIAKNESILIDYSTTVSEIKMLRLPFLAEGETNAKRYAVRSYLKSRNYRIAPVSVDFYDWDWVEPYQRCKSKDNKKGLLELEELFLRNAREQLLYSERLRSAIYGADSSFTHILLLHYTQVTSTFLDHLLSEYEKMNVQWVSLEEALKNKKYDEDTTFLNKSGEPFLVQAATSRKLNLSSIYQPEGDAQMLKNICK